MMEVTQEQEKQIHYLISKIESEELNIHEDIRNLYNLIHVCMGEGIRLLEFRKGT